MSREIDDASTLGAGDFLSRMVDQNDLLRAQIRALIAGPTARRRKFRLLEIVCEGCGDLLIEVLNTSPFPVVRRRRIRKPETDTPPGSRERAQANMHERRAGEWEFHPIPRWEFDDDRPGSEPTVCRCRRVNIPSREISDCLRRGDKKRTWPMPIVD